MEVISRNLLGNTIMEPRKGLEWEQGTFNSEPRWTIEPSIDLVRELACRYLNLSSHDASNSTIAFEVQGAFNKLYAFECSRGSYFMRVTLPVDPRYKTLSETATIDYLLSRTSIPVPKVLAHNASTENDLHFEWMLMERVMAKDLRHTWPSMDWTAKTALAKTIANVMAQLFLLQFHRIGSLYRAADVDSSSQAVDERIADEDMVDTCANMTSMFFQSTFRWVRSLVPYHQSHQSEEKTSGGGGGVAETFVNSTLRLFRFLSNRTGRLFMSSRQLRSPTEIKRTSSTKEFVVDRIVSMFFFWDTRYTMDVPRGPFSLTRDWLLARLNLVENETKNRLEEEGLDEEDIDDDKRALVNIRRLKEYLPTFFPLRDEPEVFALHHDDISNQNILVDETGVLKALIDWECVSVLPLWKVCQVPAFLKGQDCYEKPDPDKYVTEVNGTKNSAYASDVKAYESTLLRKVFLDEMKSLAPEWIVAHERSQKQVDFDKAIELCDSYWLGRVEKWLNASDTGGEYQPLTY